MKKLLAASVAVAAAAFGAPAFAQFHDNSRLYDSFSMGFESLPDKSAAHLLDLCNDFSGQTDTISNLRAAGTPRADLIKELDKRLPANSKTNIAVRTITRTIVDVVYDYPVSARPQIASAVNSTCIAASAGVRK
ncbi:hypothetical protein QTI24_01395 [Variovorax sp. J22P240]|uniref:hypothetical protein n=1 Tax=Variovorax sp. J22P240 TaxID=3053514 RepID=UPI0025766092|nr:hypothetical protein [Variovorax sp. J22P240]MDL9997236.1 hypothetical protein [Variovorax sp. J22P240]